MRYDRKSCTVCVSELSIHMYVHICMFLRCYNSRSDSCMCVCLQLWKQQFMKRPRSIKSTYPRWQRSAQVWCSGGCCIGCSVAEKSKRMPLLFCHCRSSQCTQRIDADNERIRAAETTVMIYAGKLKSTLRCFEFNIPPLVWKFSLKSVRGAKQGKWKINVEHFPVQWNDFLFSCKS